MTQKLNLSNTYALNLRKYFLGPIFLLIGVFFIIKGSFWFKLSSLILSLISLFYLSLKKVAFDNENIYIDGNRYKFNQLTKLRSLEINFYAFPYLEIDDDGKKRRIITDSGQAGLLSVLLGIFIPRFDPLKNIKKFKVLFEESRSN